MEPLILTIKIIESLEAEWRGLSVDSAMSSDTDRAKMVGVADGLVMAQQVAQSVFDKMMEEVAGEQP